MMISCPVKPSSDLIRGLRQKLGMTQEEFAREIAVTVWTVNRWENAHAEPSKLAWKAIEYLTRKRGLTADPSDRRPAYLAWRRKGDEEVNEDHESEGGQMLRAGTA